MHPDKNSDAATNQTETRQRDVLTLIAIHLNDVSRDECFRQMGAIKKGDPSGPPKCAKITSRKSISAWSQFFSRTSLRLYPRVS
jgi:hypothetical protein